MCGAWPRVCRRRSTSERGGEGAEEASRGNRVACRAEGNRRDVGPVRTRMRLCTSRFPASQHENIFALVVRDSCENLSVPKAHQKSRANAEMAVDFGQKIFMLSQGKRDPPCRSRHGHLVSISSLDFSSILSHHSRPADGAHASSLLFGWFRFGSVFHFLRGPLQPGVDRSSDALDDGPLPSLPPDGV